MTATVRAHPVRNRILFYSLSAIIIAVMSTNGKAILWTCWTTLTYRDAQWRWLPEPVPFRQADGSLTPIGDPYSNLDHQVVTIGSFPRLGPHQGIDLRYFDVNSGEPLKIEILESPVRLEGDQFVPNKYGTLIVFQRDFDSTEIAPWILNRLSFEDWLAAFPVLP